MYKHWKNYILSNYVFIYLFRTVPTAKITSHKSDIAGRENLFSVRYELNSYMQFRRILTFGAMPRDSGS
jgi:hypothetical protein